MTVLPPFSYLPSFPPLEKKKKDKPTFNCMLKSQANKAD